MINSMFANLKRLSLTLALLGAITSASGYSLLMPLDTWMTPVIGYSPQIGGPANQFVGEEYHVTRTELFYAFDISFLDFFGSKGTNAVAGALNIFNAIPAASTLSANLAEYPLDSTRINYQASALNLYDLKSMTLSIVMEQMGVADPINWTWCLRDRAIFGSPPVTNYTVIKRNYDPVTRDISSFVNGVLYTYVVVEDGSAADAVEIRMDPLLNARPVASGNDGFLGVGKYYTGLTRDDIGGWKRLYERTTVLQQNHVESLPIGTDSNASSSPWLPAPGGTNSATNTIAIVTNAIRSGVDKITFKTGNYDSYLGAYVTPVTNRWDDIYRTNMFAPLQTQKVQRVIFTPDFLFTAEDLGTAIDGTPFLFLRSSTASWINNDAINGVTVAGGPGTIEGPVTISFSSIGPYIMNQNAFLMDELNYLTTGVVWGSFDGTTNDPVVYPTWSSAQDLKLQVINSSGSPWTIPNASVTNAP